MVTSENWLSILIVVLVSYLIGSLPTAYIIGKLRNVNIFEIGSGNMGGTNVARALGLGYGLLTAFIDICKGVAAVIVARMMMPETLGMATSIASIVSIVGHNWSLFASLLYAAANRGTRFVLRGGKGAATAFGTLLMIAPVQIIVAMLAIGGILILVTRYVSLGVLAAFAISLSWVLALSLQNLLPVDYIPYTLIVGVMIGWRFRDNIQRLVARTERRLGERAAIAPHTSA